jgi:predicted DNA-binding helix-hairpin-helix protein
LYGAYKLKRVYYSAFSPIPQSPNSVPLRPPPLLREHRLYQADFLLRSYKFQVPELLPSGGDLALDIDPKLAWALTHRDQFPLDLNYADLSLIIRVPGIGLRNAKRLVELRRQRKIRYDDLVRLHCSMKKLQPFIMTADYRPQQASSSSDTLRRVLADAPQQLNLW